MMKLLFEEKESDVKEVFDKLKWVKIMFYIYSIMLLAVFIICLISKEFIASIFLFICFIIILIMAIRYSIPVRQYLYIYEDKIICKRAYRGEEIIEIRPSDYFIKLRRQTSRDSYIFRMIFMDSEGEIFLIYKVASLKPSLYQDKKQKWEVDLFNIGCDIIDDEEVIKNR